MTIVRLSVLAMSAVLATACGGSSGTADGAALPAEIAAIMNKPRYVAAGAKWSLVVMDARTGEIVHAVDPDRLSFTGSVRKLFSVGVALDTLGPDHRFTTSVFRTGSVSAQGVLAGDLVLVGAGDLTFGGRAKADGTLDYTEFDHNEAPAFGGSGLTPQDPLAAIDELARQVRAAGIQRVTGDLVVDDRLFDSFRVPNGNVLISPILINENLIDVTVAPGAAAGDPARIDWRPRISGFAVAGGASTTAPGTPADLAVRGDDFERIGIHCLGAAQCQGTVSSTASRAAGAIPADYRAPLVGGSQFVGVLRVEDPPTFARIALIDALARAGVTVAASAVARNATERLPARSALTDAARVAAYVSQPYAEHAKLVLKVSLNTGANLSLVHVGLAHGQRTREGALAVERRLLVERIGLDPQGFVFPTNGSGSPDSRASARTTARLITALGTRPGYAALRAGLPRLGVDGSLASIGKDVVGKEHIAAKSGATVDDQGRIAAISMAGTIDAKSGRALAFALFVNDAGPLTNIGDTLAIFEDEAAIAGIIYARN